MWQVETVLKSLQREHGAEERAKEFHKLINDGEDLLSTEPDTLADKIYKATKGEGEEGEGEGESEPAEDDGPGVPHTTVARTTPPKSKPEKVHPPKLTARGKGHDGPAEDASHDPEDQKAYIEAKRLIEGATDPKVWNQIARGYLKRKGTFHTKVEALHALYNEFAERSGRAYRRKFGQDEKPIIFDKD